MNEDDFVSFRTNGRKRAVGAWPVFNENVTCISTRKFGSFKSHNAFSFILRLPQPFLFFCALFLSPSCRMRRIWNQNEDDFYYLERTTFYFIWVTCLTRPRQLQTIPEYVEPSTFIILKVALFLFIPYSYFWRLLKLRSAPLNGSLTLRSNCVVDVDVILKKKLQLVTSDTHFRNWRRQFRTATSKRCKCFFSLFQRISASIVYYKNASGTSYVF